jgi:hypothetical protein
VALVADSERDRAVGLLRQSYVQGRLNADELSDRVSRALGARTHWELGSALSGLPGQSALVAVARAHPLARAASHAIARALTFVALCFAWLVGSSMLLTAFVVVAVVGEATAAASVAFLLAWALLTWGIWRVWRSGAGPSG